MLRRWRRNFHPQNEAPGCGRQILGTTVLLVCYVPVLIALLALEAPAWLLFPGVLMAMLAGTAAMLRVMHGSLRTGVSTDSEGFREHFWLGRRRRVRWADITAVEQSDDGAVVRHLGGELKLEPPLADWAQLAAMAQRHLNGERVDDEQDDEVRALPPEEVAAWLGIERDGELTDRSRFRAWAKRGLAAWLVALVACFQAHLIGPAVLLEITGLVAITASGMQGVLGRRRGASRGISQIRATADCLEVRGTEGWRSYAWGGIKSLRRVGVFWVATTTEGDLWLPPDLRCRERLLAAMRGAIDARRQGFTLPRLTGDVPAAALSPAVLRVDAERGLSASTEE